MSVQSIPFARLAGLLALSVLPLNGAAAEIVVRVSGVTAANGEIGCALFERDTGFPMDNTSARVRWQAAAAEGVTCRFADVVPGRYAVSVVHDLNGNRRVDTNLIGLPTEAWGVSNGVRPTLRAPRFDEAAFVVKDNDGDTVLDVAVGR
ncbi:DUF2141 domain-containing protein [Methyloversatilis sp. XJ19-49]|uniref:DUF2141 domain-containing protein n=1 Tax=Methyloversatilis sp. XJ19-49 TaxID=2963429 RepID=UPI00211C7B2F|nr:DUF2141 domain-containing protein [Methyloversatilis sp. XJ19-49]MCQ9376961.1 DUF2141 domain-containing protein [Methyloversatilis sp. XJ19-49]